MCREQHSTNRERVHRVPTPGRRIGPPPQLAVVDRRFLPLPAISSFDCPACQCVKISQISITSNVLLAIGSPRLKDEGNHRDFPMTGSTPTRTS
jgi:hypothetical protein